MPFVFNKNSSFYKLFVWEINESFNDLLSLAKLNDEEKIKMSGFKSEQRRLQFLATRAIIKNQFADNVDILYNSNGQPYLSNGLKISISHTKNYASVIISEFNVGVDIELVHKKILNIIPKFLSEKEQYNLNLNDLNSLFLYWGAKETIVKLKNNKSYIYNRELYIEPFEAIDEGIFYGSINQNKVIQTIEFNYKILDNLVIVWSFTK